MNCILCNSTIPENKLRCTNCGKWNAYSQTTLKTSNSNIVDQTVLLSEVTSAEEDRLDVGVLNRVFGGGLVVSSVTLIGGSPGAGKSTIFLQLFDIIVNSIKQEVMYIAAEESLPEIRMRGNRIKTEYQHLIRMVPAMGGLSDLGGILLNHKPKAIIIDSLAGLVGKDDEAALRTCAIAKEYAIFLKAPVIIAQHVTKADVIAGEMTLQHAVDTTMTFFPDEESGIRELLVTKNRFGPAFVSIFFEMTAEGLLPRLDLDNEEEEETDED